LRTERARAHRGTGRLEPHPGMFFLLEPNDLEFWAWFPHPQALCWRTQIFPLGKDHKRSEKSDNSNETNIILTLVNPPNKMFLQLSAFSDKIWTAYGHQPLDLHVLLVN
jgi:hypothetical protein